MSFTDNLLNQLRWEKIKYRNNNINRKKIINNWGSNGGTELTPHVIKQEIINYFRKEYSINTLVETGTFQGEMVYAHRNNFNKIISIELSEELFRTAKKRLSKYKNIELYCGDSGSLLKQIVKDLSEPAIFWLDGHYSGFETAKGDTETPIKLELDAILNSDLKHIILIDDARLFVGKNDYPTVRELKSFILAKRKNYVINIDDDVIRITP